MASLQTLVYLGFAVGGVALLLKHMGREDMASVVTWVGFAVGLGVGYKVVFDTLRSLETIFHLSGIV